MHILVNPIFLLCTQNNTLYVAILDFDIGNHTTIRHDQIVVLKMGFMILLTEIYDCQDSLALNCFLYLLRVNWEREREREVLKWCSAHTFFFLALLSWVDLKKDEKESKKKGRENDFYGYLIGEMRAEKTGGAHDIFHPGH